MMSNREVVSEIHWWYIVYIMAMAFTLIGLTATLQWIQIIGGGLGIVSFIILGVVGVRKFSNRIRPFDVDCTLDAVMPCNGEKHEWTNTLPTGAHTFHVRLKPKGNAEFGIMYARFQRHRRFHLLHRMRLFPQNEIYTNLRIIDLKDAGLLYEPPELGVMQGNVMDDGVGGLKFMYCPSFVRSGLENVWLEITYQANKACRAELHISASYKGVIRRARKTIQFTEQKASN